MPNKKRSYRARYKRLEMYYVHTVRRYHERYSNAPLSKADYAEMNRRAAEAPRTKTTSSRVYVEFMFRGQCIRAIYSNSQKRIVTVLPPHPKEAQ
jgi:hypothetical protein